MLSREWRCIWSSTDRRCSNYIWVMKVPLILGVCDFSPKDVEIRHSYLICCDKKRYTCFLNIFIDSQRFAENMMWISGCMPSFMWGRIIHPVLNINGVWDKPPLMLWMNPSENIQYDLYNSATLQWRHNERDGVSSHQPHDCYSTVYFGADQRKHRRSALLAFVRGIRRWTVNSPHEWLVTRKMLPFYDVIMMPI